MPHYRTVGDVPRKRHTMHRGADGARRPEELMGQHGFSSSSSLLYHLNSPSALVSIEPVLDETRPPDAATPDVPLTPRHLRTGELAADIRLEHVGTWSFAGGMVQSTYRVRR